MKWFRFWTDTLDDVKILQLSDYEYRIWTYLLAIASEVNSMSGECQVNVKSMSLRCRTQVNHFSRALETFQRVGLITINRDGYPVICNWSKRQFKSDDVTARVHKHRKVTTQRNVSCNVSETDQITDTDTDTYKKNIKKKKKTLIAEDFKISDRVRKWASEKGINHLEDHFESFKRKCSAKGYEYIDWDSAFMEAIRENWAKLGNEKTLKQEVIRI